MPCRALVVATACMRGAALQSKRPIQVVVDVDDTVKSSGNVRLLDIPLGGIDAQFERGEFYPGVCDFCFELAIARTSEPEPVAVLTARAEEFAFALKLDENDKVVKTFRECGLRRGQARWGVATDRVLYGSAHEWVFQDFKGWRKFLNFGLLAERFPASAFVFVGDTGERDEEAGELMCYKYPAVVDAVLLHAVGTETVPEGYAVNGVPIRFFRTYAQAAQICHALGLLDASAVDRVCDRGLAEASRYGDSRRADVERDVERWRSKTQFLHSTPIKGRRRWVELPPPERLRAPLELRRPRLHVVFEGPRVARRQVRLDQGVVGAHARRDGHGHRRRGTDVRVLVRRIVVVGRLVFIFKSLVQEHGGEGRGVPRWVGHGGVPVSDV